MEQLRELESYLAKLAPGGLCLAFSGGVDSTLLLMAACGAAPGTVHAVTMYTPFHSPVERREAAEAAAGCGAVHTVLSMDRMPDAVMANPPNRCYLCKRTIFETIADYAREHGLAYILDGTNADDLGEYRPGLGALRELNVVSPLAELGYTKAVVRRMAAAMGLPVADKPSAPCMATRFPYHTVITPQDLEKVERIEAAVKDTGVRVVRARVHGDTIRLEVPPDGFGTVLEHRVSLLETVRAQGYLRLTLDLAGYKSGSFDGPYRGEE